MRRGILVDGDFSMFVALFFYLLHQNAGWKNQLPPVMYQFQKIIENHHV
jgi:hypothetical protein